MDLIIKCDAVATRLYKSYIASLELTIEGAELTEILEHISIEDVIQHFGKQDLLTSIGIEAAMDQFDLKESDE